MSSPLDPEGSSLGALADDLARVGDPEVRQRARAFAGALLEAHGEGLARLLDLVQQHGGDAADDVLQAVVEDPLTSSLLVLHDLHPVPVDARVARALDLAVGQLGPVGDHVHLEGVEADVVRVRLDGPADSPQARVGIESLLARLLRTHAPDVDHLELLGPADVPGSRRQRLPMVTS